MTHSIQGLIRTSWLMAGLAIAFCLALVVDPRTVDGAPAWLKPAKFAISLSLYGFTFAWMLRQLPAWPRVACWGAWVTTAAALIELGLIAMQAGRGVASHFNTRTSFDGAVFAIMGFAIATQTLAAGAVAIAMWSQRFQDRAMGWAMRRRRFSDRLRTTVVLGAGISYGALFVLLLAQALGGQAVTAPSGWILHALALWSTATGALLALACYASLRGVALNSRPIKETT